MSENKTIRFFILIYWTLFTVMSVLDKIIPDVYPLWVGTDFYTLFVKFFSSIGLTDPLFATIALAGVSLLEIVAFVCYLTSLINLCTGKNNASEHWFYGGISVSVLIFSLFSIGDQVFGDRFTLLEHGVFWIVVLVSWVIYNYNSPLQGKPIIFSFSPELKLGLAIGVVLTIITSCFIFNFSKNTYSNKSKPVGGEEVVEGIYKFDMPFLADKLTMENTIKAFEESHPNLKINYIYTGPDELNSKKKTHIVLYVFTERKN